MKYPRPCADCGTSFTPSNPTKKRSYCGECQYKRKRRWRLANLESVRKKDKEYRRAHPMDKEYSREHRLRRDYGISVGQYREMLARQAGRCAICRKKPMGAGYQMGRLHVDHDHATGKVRGLLCNTCNALLGYYEKHHELLSRCEAYRKDHRVESELAHSPMPSLWASLGDETETSN